MEKYTICTRAWYPSKARNHTKNAVGRELMLIEPAMNWIKALALSYSAIKVCGVLEDEEKVGTVKLLAKMLGTWALYCDVEEVKKDENRIK